MKGFGSRVLASLLLTALFGVVVFAYEVDDTVPEVTERVARISFLRGDVQVRRDGSQEWEKAELNLPIVEGDEIAVEAGGRLEIQFDKDQHLRVDESTLLRVTQLSESGVALSVSRGTVSARLRKLDSDREFFEIDGPGTTIAMHKAGTYRFDAGRDDQTEVFLTVTDGGEARVYSSTSGFSLPSGRLAKIVVAGNRVGEWESSDVSRLGDEFAEWLAERDALIEKVLADSHYGKYYDQDIYGAEDLNSYGDWEYTSDYGYIWTPYRRSISVYSDWSPYRYGNWRWIPPFGWTWVNHEPWGWATYHHGRWIWYRGRWVWTPYGFYRSNRSWWRPALVVVKIINRSICWYPLGYRHRYNNYNAYHDWVGNRAWRRRDHDDDRRRDRGRDERNAAVVPSASPVPSLPENGPVRRRGELPVEPPGPELDGRNIEPTIPSGGIVSLPEEEFGREGRIARRAAPEIARRVLERRQRSADQPETLPAYEAVRGRISASTPRAVSAPRVVRNNNAGIRVGVSDRMPDVPLDRDLQRNRIYGGRQPLPQIENLRRDNDRGDDSPSRRPVGAVTRAPEPRQETPLAEQPANRRLEPVRRLPRLAEPTRELPSKNIEPKVEPPIWRAEPAPGQEPRRDTAPPRQERPDSYPPARRQFPRREQPQPRNDAPRSEPPTPQPQPRNGPPRREPPAQRPAPRNDSPRPTERNPSPPPARERPAPRTDSKPTRKPDPIER